MLDRARAQCDEWQDKMKAEAGGISAAAKSDLQTSRQDAAKRTMAEARRKAMESLAAKRARKGQVIGDVA